MSTDSTELTFVRCPSCRSLVPASQTRCRMCGASLEASGKSNDDAEKQAAKSSRVKQRTMSVQQVDVAQAVAQASEAEYQSPAPETDAAATVSEPNDPPPVELSPDDPLGPYLEEVAADAEEPDPMHVDQADGDQDDYAFLDEDPEDFDDFIDDEPEQEIAQAKPSNGALKVEAVAPAVPEPVVEKPPVVATQPVTPQVRVESGPRKQSLGLSFSRSKDEKRELKEEPKERREEKREERHEERRSDRHAAPRPETSKPQSKGPTVGGRLFGWLVSYHNPDGAAVELREGKFFISRTSLKPNDFVLDDDSVSTPHALVNISIDKGFQVQDLMSERGVFIRRRQGDTYQKEDMATVQHGDWVRFGDLEFLVSLVAHVGVK